MSFKCKECGKEFNSRNKNPLTCSRECYDKLRKRLATGRGTKARCINCNDYYIKSRKSQKYCGATCQMKYEYSNGIRNKKEIVQKAHEKIIELSLKRFKENPTIFLCKRGYYVIHIPKYSDYPFKKGRRYYHHYVWETENKKPMEKGFCVHHKDGNPLNNFIENLEYMKISEHNLIKRRNSK